MKKVIIIFLIISSICAKAQKAKKADTEGSSAKEKIELRIENLKKTAGFIQDAHNSFMAVDVSLKQSQLMTDIVQINNPTNSKLGFSISDAIKRAYKKHILDNDKGLQKDAANVNNYVDKILNNPITNIVKSFVPTVNSVISFITSLSFGGKSIKPEHVENFIKDVNQYMVVYERLAQATTNYEIQTQQIKNRINASETILLGYANDRLLGLVDQKSISEDDLAKSISMLTSKKIDSYLDEKFVRYKKEFGFKSEQECYQEFIEQGEFILYPTAISQARYIQDEIENLTTQYIQIQKNYLSEIVAVLNNSKKLEGAKSDNIDETAQELTNKFKEWSTEFQVQIKIKLLKEVVRELSKIKND